MSFVPDRLTLAVDTIGGGSLRIHFYETEDDRDLVIGDGYFSEGKKRGLREGDIVVVNQPGLGNFVVRMISHTTATFDTQFLEPATQAEAEAGTMNLAGMTPLRTSQLITARLAAQAEAEAGTNNTKLVTPLRAAQAITGFPFAAGGTVARTNVDRAADMMSVLEWIPRNLHANIKAGTNTTDLTSYFALALASGSDIYVPSGTYKITNKLSIPANRVLKGAGVNSTIFSVTTDFTLAATSIFALSNWSIAQDFRVSCTQTAAAASGVAGDLVQYPWVFDISAGINPVLRNLLVDAGYKGIKGDGNCGGGMIDNVKMGAWHTGLLVDGPLHTFHVVNYDFWCYGGGDGGLKAIFDLGQCIALDLGRCDDFEAVGFMSFKGRILIGDKGKGPPIGSFSKLGMDSFGAQLDMTAGYITVVNAYKSTNADDFGFRIAGGQFTLLGLEAQASSNTQAFVQVSGATTSAKFKGGQTRNISTTASIFQQDGGVLSIEDFYFNEGVNQTRAAAKVKVNSGRITFVNNRSTDKGSGTGALIEIATDNLHVITGNNFAGWKYMLPASAPNGLYGPNNVLTADATQGGQVVTYRDRHLTGTLDGTGSAVIALGLSNIHTKVISVTAWRDNGGARVPLTVSYIDGANVSVTAGSAAFSGYNATVVVRYYP